MAKTIAVANQKGGVGKQQLLYLAAIIASSGFRVLLVDADPQGTQRPVLGFSAGAFVAVFITDSSWVSL
jgi:cellulose biosynthesis protein BcsQ